MINPNANGNYPVDLRNVTHVRIGNQWTDIQPGTFTFGEPVFFIQGRGKGGEGAWTYGSGFGGTSHPLSYFFLDTGGSLHTGPYHHIQEMKATRPEPVKREPTGPRVYVEHRLGGTQGHIVAMVPLEGANDGTAVPEVQWYQPGAQPVREKTGNLLFITADRVERCLNGQTRDECTEIDPCEACQQDIDAEGDVIEESMGL